MPSIRPGQGSAPSCSAPAAPLGSALCGAGGGTAVARSGRRCGRRVERKGVLGLVRVLHDAHKTLQLLLQQVLRLVKNMCDLRPRLERVVDVDAVKTLRVFTLYSRRHASRENRLGEVARRATRGLEQGIPSRQGEPGVRCEGICVYAAGGARQAVVAGGVRCRMRVFAKVVSESEY